MWGQLATDGTNMNEQLLRIQEVMSLLQIGKTTVYRLVAEGKLPTPYKIGNSVRFKKSEVLLSIEPHAGRSREGDSK